MRGQDLEVLFDAEAAQALDKSARDLRLVFSEETGKLPARSLANHAEFEAALAAALARLDQLAAALKGQVERSEGLARCGERAGLIPNDTNPT